MNYYSIHSLHEYIQKSPGKPLPGQKIAPKSKIVPNGTGQAAPSWVVHDRQVLRFSAYFQEAVHEKREEKYRIRK